MKWAVVDPDGLVENVVLWDGETVWSLPTGFTLIELDEASTVGPGDTIDDKGKVTRKAEPAPVIEDDDVPSVVIDRAAVARANTLAELKAALLSRQ